MTRYAKVPMEVEELPKDCMWRYRAYVDVAGGNWEYTPECFAQTTDEAFAELLKLLQATELPAEETPTPTELPLLDYLRRIAGSIQFAIGLAANEDWLDVKKHLWKALEKVRAAEAAIPKEDK